MIEDHDLNVLLVGWQLCVAGGRRVGAAAELDAGAVEAAEVHPQSHPPAGDHRRAPRLPRQPPAADQGAISPSIFPSFSLAHFRWKKCRPCSRPRTSLSLGTPTDTMIQKASARGWRLLIRYSGRLREISVDLCIDFLPISAAVGLVLVCVCTDFGQSSSGMYYRILTLWSILTHQGLMDGDHARGLRN